MDTGVGCWAIVMIRYGTRPINSYFLGWDKHACESSRVAMCAKAGSALCLLVKRRSSFPALVKQLTVLGCNWIFSPFFFTACTSQLLFQWSCAPFCGGDNDDDDFYCITLYTFSWYIEEVSVWRTVVLYWGALASPKWTCLPSGSSAGLSGFVPNGAN